VSVNEAQVFSAAEAQVFSAAEAQVFCFIATTFSHRPGYNRDFLVQGRKTLFHRVGKLQII
jgi:hypothetical protein